MTLRELRQHLRGDWEAHGRPVPLASPGYQTVALYRLGTWAKHRPQPWRAVLLAIHLVVATICRNVYGIELPLDARIGRRFWIAHQSGIVIGHGVVIGDDCVVRQNVTIGVGRRGSAGEAPQLDDRVEVGAGAVLLGGVWIGDGAKIGPNAVVMKDVPAGGSAFAASARVMAPMSKERTSSGDDSGGLS